MAKIFSKELPIAMDQPYPASWTEANFAKMCWHEATIHGIGFNNPPMVGSTEDYVFDLILNITYILERSLRNNICDFVVAPARLTFHKVDSLRFTVHPGHQEEMEIDTIEREEITTEEQWRADYHVYRWMIKLHSLYNKPGWIAFESPGFIQTLTGPQVLRCELESEEE